MADNTDNSYTGTAYLGAGSPKASTGTIRIASNTSMWARNNANTGDVQIFGVGSSDSVSFATTSGVTAITFGRTGITTTVGGSIAVETSMTVGSAAATTGPINMANNASIWCRNNANSGDIAIISCGTSDQVRLGATATGIDLLGTVTVTDGKNFVVGSTTGTKIGTSTSQKLAFFNSSPIVQPASTTDLRTALINLGLLATGGATPLNLNGGALTAATVTATTLREGLQAHSTTGSTETIDLANGTVHTATLDANCTFTFSGSAASVACSFTLIAKQDGTGSRTATWPASVDWPGGVAPTLSTAANAVDILVFTTVDNGTTWYGNLAGRAYS